MNVQEMHMNRHDTKEQFKREKGLIRETMGKIGRRNSLGHKGRAESIQGLIQHEYADAQDGARSRS